MPLIYASRIANVIQLTNESDAKFHIQANVSLQTTTQSTLSSTSSTSTTPSPKDLSTTATVIIVLAVISVFIILCVAICCIYRRKKRHKPTSTHLPLVVPPGGGGPPPINPGRGPSSAPPRNPRAVPPLLHCLKPLCREYLNGLNLNKAYFDSRYDECFCEKCHNPKTCEHWCKQQHDWVRFGLRINQAHQKGWKIFKEWKTSYYGTSSDRLASILNNRFLPHDGDRLADGTTFNSGHPDKTHCITSPSLVYASRWKFAARSNLRARDGTNYTNVQVVLQCKQKPDTYTVQTDDSSFHNTEWATVARSTVIPCGLLVRLKR